MTLPAGTNDSSPVPPDRPPRKDRVGRRLTAARVRYEGSWIHDIVTQLRALDFLNWTTIFGAELLWSALPFIILLSSLADERIDDDLSRHLGLNSQGAHIVKGLFRNSPSHAFVPIVTGLLIAFAGIIAVVASLQVVYERLFDQKHRGWRDIPRYVAWVAIVLVLLIVEGLINRPERRAAGPVVQALTAFVVATLFFGWTMHFLLDGRVPWRLFIRPALLTAILWVALGFFSSLYFSSVIIDDSKTYGTIGVVFTFLTWFILIGGVIVLGAACGAVWQQRTTRRARGADDTPRPDRLGGGDDPARVPAD
jgi:membrane protein